jgi:hypothetical protein
MREIGKLIANISQLWWTLQLTIVTFSLDGNFHNFMQHSLNSKYMVFRYLRGTDTTGSVQLESPRRVPRTSLTSRSDPGPLIGHLLLSTPSPEKTESATTASERSTWLSRVGLALGLDQQKGGRPLIQEGAKTLVVETTDKSPFVVKV